MISKLYTHPSKNSCSRLVFRRLSTKLEEEYSSEPKYPTIIDVSRPAEKAREVQAWHEKIKNLSTVEEKLIEVNIPKYYGWRCVMVKEGQISYNSMGYAQHITRTHFIDGLPAIYTSPQLDEAAKQCMGEIKSQFTEALLYEFQRELPVDNSEPQELERCRSRAAVEQLASLTRRVLGSQFPHLQNLRCDSAPRIEAAWVAGGMAPPANVRHMLKSQKKSEEEASAPRNRHIQYIGQPLLQLRSELPLPSLVPPDQCMGLTVPAFTHDPQAFSGDDMPMRHITNIPGFWPGDDHQFGVVSFHSRAHMQQRLPQYGEVEHQEALHIQAILASFGWLMPQSCYLGKYNTHCFSTFNDVTYPLTTQTVITDGRLWSLYAYQLNTTLVHDENATNNPRCNMCWGTPSLRLFEKLEDGKLIGFNDEVLMTLLKMFLIPPEERKGIELRPYLDAACPVVAKIEDEDRRAFLENRFKHLVSNRPRHLLAPEIHFWERIYKIKFKTRPMDARRRPFELWQNPWARRLDDHCPRYVPKILRKDPKQKFEKTYYP
ncbi:hypothetical protein B566_EDAN007243 [Ephemera danica]|nr:hypothetical protein B566_EDAN007243 [Ephemera danica]